MHQSQGKYSETITKPVGDIHSVVGEGLRGEVLKFVYKLWSKCHPQTRYYSIMMRYAKNVQHICACPWKKNLPQELGTRFWLFCSFC